MPRKVEEWWPLCAVCGKPVFRLLVEKKDSPLGRRYMVVCHGKVEVSPIRISRAQALAMDLNRKRLPAAFRNEAVRNQYQRAYQQ